jgi:hypothetical protein
MKPISGNIPFFLVLCGSRMDYEDLSLRGGRVGMTGPYGAVSNGLL